MSSFYSKYSTSFKFAISNGIISDSTIPSSSRQYWKTQNFKDFIGSEMDDHIELIIKMNEATRRSKRMKALCKGLLILFDYTNHLIELTGKRVKLHQQTKELLIHSYQQAKKYVSLKAICKRLKIKSSKITHWKAEAKCILSMIEKCPKLYPLQLSIREQLIIRDLLYNPELFHLPINHIWAQAQRNGLMVSLNTFYLYTRKIIGKRNNYYSIIKNYPPVQATRIFQILHMDSTQFICENGERVYMHFIMDNFSKALLGAVPSYSSKSAVVVENLKSVLHKYKLHLNPLEIYCDDGPENNGEVNKFLNSSENRIEKVVANYITKKSNNVIEAWNKKFKHSILKKFKPKSLKHLQEITPEILDYSNNLKLPRLKTLSPNEVLNGISDESLNLESKMTQAKQQRKNDNQNLSCNLTYCS